VSAEDCSGQSTGETPVPQAEEMPVPNAGDTGATGDAGKAIAVYTRA
jgi:hypothetical protein